METQCEYSNYLGKYRCEVTSNDVEKPNTEVTFDGVYLPNKTDKDVEWLCIAKKNVKFLPKNLHKKFKNIVELTVYSCGVEKISKLDLAGLENLQLLNLNDNNLTSLLDDLFASTKKLEKIYLWRNQLQHVSSNLFDPICSNMSRPCNMLIFEKMLE